MNRLGTLKTLMNPAKILKAVASFVFYLLLYVALPALAIYLSQGDPGIRGLLDMMKSLVGIDVISIASTIVIIGFLVAVTALISGLTEKWSAVNLISSITSTVLQLAIQLTVLGVGDIGSLGIVSRTVSLPGPSQPSFIMDMRFIALALVVIAVLKAVLALAEFYSARGERERQRFSAGGVLQRIMG